MISELLITMREVDAGQRWQWFLHSTLIAVVLYAFVLYFSERIRAMYAPWGMYHTLSRRMLALEALKIGILVVVWFSSLISVTVGMSLVR